MEAVETKNWSINVLRLSIRAHNGLLNGNVETIGELCKRTRKQLLRHANIGEVSVNEIENKLKAIGIELPDTELRRIWIPGFWHYI